MDAGVGWVLYSLITFERLMDDFDGSFFTFEFWFAGVLVCGFCLFGFALAVYFGLVCWCVLISRCGGGCCIFDVLVTAVWIFVGGSMFVFSLILVSD